MNIILDEYVEIRNSTLGIKPDKLLVTEKGKPVYEKLIYRVVKNNLAKVTSLEKKSPQSLQNRKLLNHLL